ncbi:hypothetical protein ACIBO1_11905 [Micromonospora sp. NPDC049903]|uniref:hypothetical protein n=1 Tax=Micromonospora sp. NPDC049903 TaxID=3364276 RepID=UPI00378D29A4
MEGPTQIIPVAPEPSPVFVDPSGRRRRWLRRTAYALGLAGVAYTMMVGISFAGGPVRPDSIIPFVEPAETWEAPPVSPTPSPSRSTSPAPPPTQVTPQRPVLPSSTPGTGTTSASPTPSPSRTAPTSARPSGTPTPSPSRSTPPRSTPPPSTPPPSSPTPTTTPSPEPNDTNEATAP